MKNNRGYSYKQAKSAKRKRWLVFAAILLILFGLAAYWQWSTNQNSLNISQTTPNQVAETPPEQTSEKEPTVEPLPSVQKLVEDWAATALGQYSIVVYDVAADKQLASHRADEEYFAASIYKLYVAYLGLIDIQKGLHAPSETYLNGWSRQKCIQEMIRISHSPCAEKMWNEQGKQTATERLEKFGLTGTSMVNLTTTVHDTTIILTRLQKRTDLTDASAKILLAAMEKQIYRDTIPAGIPDLMVANKVGFRDLVEYHDVAIVSLPDQRPVSISILTRNAGTRRIADITSRIFTSLRAD